MNESEKSTIIDKVKTWLKGINLAEAFPPPADVSSSGDDSNYLKISTSDAPGISISTTDDPRGYLDIDEEAIKKTLSELGKGNSEGILSSCLISDPPGDMHEPITPIDASKIRIYDGIDSDKIALDSEKSKSFSEDWTIRHGDCKIYTDGSPIDEYDRVIEEAMELADKNPINTSPQPINTFPQPKTKLISTPKAKPAQKDTEITRIWDKLDKCKK